MNLINICSAVFCALFSGEHLHAANAKSRPKILLIYVDDLAYNDIGCYSYPGDIASSEAPPLFPEKVVTRVPTRHQESLMEKLFRSRLVWMRLQNRASS